MSNITVGLQNYIQKVGASFTLLLEERGPFSSVSTPQRNSHCGPPNETEINVYMHQNIHTSDVRKSPTCFGTSQVPSSVSPLRI